MDIIVGIGLSQIGKLVKLILIPSSEKQIIYVLFTVVLFPA